MSPFPTHPARASPARTPSGGRVPGIDGGLTVAEIMAELVEGFGVALGAAADRYLRS